MVALLDVVTPAALALWLALSVAAVVIVLVLLWRYKVSAQARAQPLRLPGAVAQPACSARADDRPALA
ncbi:MAG: hypothetical protein AVDCRST_MAG77-3997 [uncultured Chloroflexi bacterium]|uniref:Uncharacterized protein n=1 Tax=uncultured Chloroflexota bacterium TaxID=166587 RepID=A0A6J4JNL0_9CHLR|nr:MAG: hypothetical protein AVDCRST_MAG77-3997 [uncultured Chloroflexota bacterium]